MNRFIISSLALTGLLGFVACTTGDDADDNTGGSSSTTSSQGGSTTSTGGNGQGGSTSSTGGAGGSTTGPTAVCAGLAATPTDTCVTLGGANACNPVSNAADGGGTCDTQACDSNDMSGYSCFDLSATVAACGETCSTNGNFCDAGYTCTDKDAFMGTDIHANPVCARWCCDDADCGGGVCVSVNQAAGPGLGVCLSAAP